MTDEAELLAAKKIFSIGIPGAKQRISGRFATPGAIQQAAGIYPQVEVRGYKSFTEFDAISARKSRTAVNSLIDNALSKQGKGLNTYLSSSDNQALFRRLGRTPHRIALNAVESNNAIDKNEAMMQYLELVVPYVNEHAGGIIGDAIKEEFIVAMDIRDIEDQIERRRILDFVTGMAFISDAKLRSINKDGVFLVLPSNSSLPSDERERLQELGLYKINV